MPAFDAPIALATSPQVRDAADPRRREVALADLRRGFGRWQLPAALAWLDIRNRYRGSVLGPLWLTLSMAVMVGGLGLLYSKLFHLALVDYMPFLVVSLALWSLINTTATEACTSLTGAEGIIRQLPLPYSVHALRTVLRNALVAAHHLPLVLLILVLVGRAPGVEALWALPGLALIGLASFSSALFLGMLCARFRDIAQIVGSVMQLVFFLSPILWKPELLGTRAVLLPLNPIFTLMETVRGPLLGNPPGPDVWASAIIATLVVTVAAFAFFVRYRARIAFWV